MTKQMGVKSSSHGNLSKLKTVSADRVLLAGQPPIDGMIRVSL